MTFGNKEVFSKNLKKHIERSKKNRKDIAKSLGLPYSTITDWINGRKYPRIDNIEKLAGYFGICKSDLIEDFDKKKKDNEALATIIVKIRTDAELFEIVSKLISLDKAKVQSLNKLLDTFI